MNIHKMAFRALFSVCLIAVAVAVPSDLLRAVPNPKTPNQILDRVAEDAVKIMTEKNWIPTKNVQNGEVDIPVTVDGKNDGTTDKFTFTNADITGLGSLRRSASASFNADKSQLTGKLRFTDISAEGTYEVAFPGAGVAASANTASGTVTETGRTFFCDISLNIKDLVPQSIAAYDCYKGRNNITATNLSGDYATIHRAGMQKALLQQIESVCETNVKVAINQGIQAWKNEA